MQTVPVTASQASRQVSPELEARVRRATTIVEALRLRAEHQPDRAVLSFVGDDSEASTEVSYADLDRRARRVGALLQSYGACGQPVLIMLPPGVDYAAAFWGCQYAGAVAVPVYPPVTPALLRRVEQIAKDCGARISLTDKFTTGLRTMLQGADSLLTTLSWLELDSIAEGSEAFWRSTEIDPAELALLQYTSGSTGAPKGVMIAHSNLRANLASVCQALSRLMGVDEHAVDRLGTDTGLSWLPPYHDMGLSGLLLPVIIGGYSIQCSPAWFIRHPERWIQEISRRRIAFTGAPNFAYELAIERAESLQDEDLDLSCWRLAVSGAEPVRWRTLQRFTQAFGRWGFDPKCFVPSYGLAEATVFVSMLEQPVGPLHIAVDKAALSNNQIELSSASEHTTVALLGCGRPLSERVLIVDPEAHTLCAPDAVGEIWISGPSVAIGYWNKPEQSQATFAAQLSNAPAGVSSGPYLRTGDTGFWQGDQLFVAGRIKEMVIIRGKNFYPADIELTAEAAAPELKTRGGAAFSIDDDVRGERLVLVHESEKPRCDVTTFATAVQHAILQEHGLRLSELVVIRRNSLPRTSSGKPQRLLVRERLALGQLRILSSHRFDKP